MIQRARTVLKRFVVLEGVDGAGTTTQLKRLGSLCAAKGIPAWTSFEPTELPTGRLVRTVLSGEFKARPETLARLFAADRGEHIYGEGGIQERLGRGELVILDRYLFSSLAYQGMACGPELPAELNASFPLPELLLFFDIDPEASMRRIEGRPSREIFEELPIQKKVRAAYEEALANFADSPMRIARIDASRPLEEVSRAVDKAMEGLLGGVGC